MPPQGKIRDMRTFVLCCSGGTHRRRLCVRAKDGFAPGAWRTPVSGLPHALRSARSGGWRCRKASRRERGSSCRRATRRRPNGRMPLLSRRSPVLPGAAPRPGISALAQQGCPKGALAQFSRVIDAQPEGLRARAGRQRPRAHGHGQERRGCRGVAGNDGGSIRRSPTSHDGWTCSHCARCRTGLGAGARQAARNGRSAEAAMRAYRNGDHRLARQCVSVPGTRGPGTVSRGRFRPPSNI